MSKAKSQLLKTLITLAVAIVAVFLFRAAVATVCCIEGNAMEPFFLAGDRVLVNRWSYGLRVGVNRFLHYNRLWRQPVERGDIVAVNDPADSLQDDISDRRVLLLCCKAVPGDTVTSSSQHSPLTTNQLVPGRYSCADKDYYLMEPVGIPPLSGKSGGTSLLVPEDHIIGRAYLIIYSHDPEQPLWEGWRSDRFLATCGLMINDK